MNYPLLKWPIAIYRNAFGLNYVVIPGKKCDVPYLFGIVIG